MTATRLMPGATSLSVSNHFPAHCGLIVGEARDMATRMRQARDQPASDGIGDHHKHDRQSRASHAAAPWSPACLAPDDVRREACQFGRLLPQMGRIAGGPAISSRMLRPSPQP